MRQKTRTLKAKKEEQRTKILLTLSALGRKVTTQELVNEAVLNDMTPMQVGQYLKYMHAKKLVRFYPKEHLWCAIKEKMPKETLDESLGKEVPKTFIMVKPSESLVYLSLAGMKIPIFIEG